MTVDYFAAPPRRSIARFLADNNPFYVLSAACMLTGIFLLNNSLTWSPLPKHNLLVLIVTLNVYELMLVALAALLLRRNVIRDARWVLVIEALFMADGGFLNMEIFTADVKLGLAVNIVLALLSAAKLALIFRAARLPIASGLYTFILVQLIVLFAIPGLFAQLASRHDGKVPNLALYMAWWTLGFLPVIFVAIFGTGRSPVAWIDHTAFIARTFVLLPATSLIAHLALSHWVFKVSFQPANLAPMLLGIAVAIGHADVSLASFAHRIRTHFGLPIAAIVLAMFSHADARFQLGSVDVAPLRLTLLAAVLVYLDGYAVHRQWLFLFASASCLGGAGLGSTPESIVWNMFDIGETCRRRLIPRTARAWGLLSIAAAFALLAVGAFFSLRNPRPESQSADREGPCG